MASDSLPDPENLLQHASFVRAVARAAIRGDDLVDDVVQETWVAALETGGARRGPLAPWLAGVARNQARNLLRRTIARRRRERAASRPEHVCPAQGVVDRLEIERQLLDAVEALPEHYRTPLVLRYLDDLPPRVIAVRLDLPVPTVRTRVRRGLALLRQHLERRHGGGARHWRLALLPLVEPVRSSTPAVSAGIGGLLVAKKALVSIVVVVALVGGIAVVTHVLSPPRTDSPDVEEPPTSASRSPAEVAPPALVGRAEDPGAGVAPVAEPEEPDGAEAPSEPSVAVDQAALGTAMSELLADIRRDVAPEWWAAWPEVGALEGRGAVVIARAPSDVLDALARYLDARRRGMSAGGEAFGEPDVRAGDAARAALRPVLRGILRRERAIGAALEAWERGHLDEARARVEEVLAEEPDNDFAVRIRKSIDPAAPGRVDDAANQDELNRLRGRLRDLRRDQTLQPWLMKWPSVTTWRAVTAIHAKAKRGIRGLAPELGELLERGHVTIDVADASLPETVRRLQLETFVDIRLSWDAAREAEQVQVAALRAEARSLRWILDALVARLPAGWTWHTARGHVLIARQGEEPSGPPETRGRIFSVVDILMPDRQAPEAPSRDPEAPPPVPPQYVRDPNGGAPVPADDPSPGSSPRPKR